MILILKKAMYRGREILYPNCPTSRIFCEMLGRPSISLVKLEYLKKMGCKIIIDN